MVKLLTSYVVREASQPTDEGENDTDDSEWHNVPLDAKILQKWLSCQVLQNTVIAG